MFKKLLITSLICIEGVSVKAQYLRYEPIGPPPSSAPAPRQELNVQILTGYLIDASTGSTQKIRLKVAAVERSIIITGWKQLSSQYWTDYTMNRPVAQKLNSYDALAEQFEYRVYIPSLSRTVYF